jgi:hypothetical protein
MGIAEGIFFYYISGCRNNDLSIPGNKSYHVKAGCPV